MKLKRPSNELEALFADSEEADVDHRLRECLAGKVAIERATGRLLVKPPLFELPQQDRILTLLLARHAIRRLGVPDAQLEAEPTTLAGEGQVSLKNCREYLSRFKAKRVIEKGKTGYYVPDWNLLLIIDRVSGGKGDSDAEPKTKRHQSGH